MPMTSEHADPAFPRLHGRPDRGWLNDPNGCSYVDGRYHVFESFDGTAAPYTTRAYPTATSRWRLRTDRPGELRAWRLGPAPADGPGRTLA